jgi:hypothetical protein
MVVIGFAAGIVTGTLSNGKFNQCKIATDAGNKNGMIRFFAGEQFVVGNNVKIKAFDVRNIELNECGGSPGTGSKITAVSFSGGVTDGDEMNVTVSDLKIRNGTAGNVNQAIRVWNDVVASNRIHVNPVTHDIQGVGAEPYRFDVAVWKDYASTRRIVGLTSDEKLASLIAQLNVNGALVEDVGFQPSDFTTAGVRAFYMADYGIQLGTTPRLSGTSPVVTISGDLQQPIGLKIKITTGGARGTAKFDWSTDNGATWVASAVFTAASVVLEQIGITVAFATGTYVLNDSYEATVEKWYDVNGGVNGPLYLIQSTVSKQFLYKVAGGPNGKPCLSAGGIDCYMSIAYTRPEPSYLYAVLKDEAGFGVGNETAIDGLTANTFRVFRSGASAWSITETGTIGQVVALPGAAPGAYHELEILFAGAGSEGLQEGVSLGTGNAGTGTTSGGLSIGGFGGISAFLHGAYCELIDLDADPSSPEKAAMRASLMAKYLL